MLATSYCYRQTLKRVKSTPLWIKASPSWLNITVTKVCRIFFKPEPNIRRKFMVWLAITTKWNWHGRNIKRKWWQHHQTGATEDYTRPLRTTAIKEYLEKETWIKKCGQQDTSTAGGRWRQQHKTELAGQKWSVTYIPSEATRHKSSKSNLFQWLRKSPTSHLNAVHVPNINNLCLFSTIPLPFCCCHFAVPIM